MQYLDQIQSYKYHLSDIDCLGIKNYLSGVKLCGGVVATEPGFDLSLNP